MNSQGKHRSQGKKASRKNMYDVAILKIIITCENVHLSFEKNKKNPKKHTYINVAIL